MKDREVANAFVVQCSGALGNSKILFDASVSVLVNGSRQVGCPMITSLSECKAADGTDGDVTLPNCVHLCPQDSEELRHD